ncbi:MAG TPA: 3-carboxy-cis,cis-muconate cycloisomerase [Caulobacteraceae bacterium]|jgi:3-carboxy-cis,cis-muconate cycloisomerase
MSALILARAAATQEMLETFSDAALVRGALAFEAALAEAEAAEGLIPDEHAAAISEACRAGGFDALTLAEAAAHAGTFAIPLTADLREKVAASAPAAAKLVHFGATSQDVADTALMLQAKAGLALIECDLARLEEALADLARRHATTPMLARTLLQGALPTTFGLKAAGWMTGIASVKARLEHEARAALALQFGGAAGTRAALGGKGAVVAQRMAAALGLANPVLPWHARRDSVAGLGAALAIVIGVLGKIARDIALMAQGEVGEAFEPQTPGRGGSSAMAHKRNPTGCQVVLSAAARAPGLTATLLATLVEEHERGLGGWQAQGPALTELFLLTHGALAALLPVVGGLEIDTEAMARNLATANVGNDVGEAAALTLAALNAVDALD